MSQPASVVIVGTGQGGFQVAASLREKGYEGRINLIGDEPGLPYQRPPLSKAYLTGEMSESSLRLRPAAFYADHRVELIDNERVTVIDRAQRRVRCRSGLDLSYDHLVLAVGARERPLQLPGADLDGVFMLRTLAAERGARYRRCRRGFYWARARRGRDQARLSGARDRSGEPAHGSRRLI
jgi:3-phenylpropionate/trans-cinnamate dioxygenase ferredoxin reductase component